MDPATPQWKRIDEVESGTAIGIWFVIGAAMTLVTGVGLLREFHAANSMGTAAMAAYSSIGLLLFFAVGLLVLGASVYTMVEKGRNKLWLDVEFPLRTAGKLRARIGSDGALAAKSGVELEATLSCKRRETQSHTDNDGKQQTQLIETPVWSAKQRFPLVAGLASSELELDIPADAPPGDPGAEGTYSAQRGIFWVLDIYFERNNVYVNRSYRLLVGAAT